MMGFGLRPVRLWTDGSASLSFLGTGTICYLAGDASCDQSADISSGPVDRESCRVGTTGWERTPDITASLCNRYRLTFDRQRAMLDA